MIIFGKFNTILGQGIVSFRVLYSNGDIKPGNIILGSFWNKVHQIRSRDMKPDNILLDSFGSNKRLEKLY